MAIAFEVLLEKFLNDELDRDQLGQFLRAAKEKQNQEKLRQSLDARLASGGDRRLSDEKEMDRMFQLVLDKAASGRDEGSRGNAQDVSFRKYAVFARIAAAIVLIAGTAAYIWLNQVPEAPPRQQQSATTIEDVQPGSNKAVLTLSNGSKIALGSAARGTLAREQGANVVQLADGQLAYQPMGGVAGSVVYNTISTPQGGQYEVILPDRTHVWLNASSSLRYPTAFTDKERTVELTGEGYFEVTHNADAPFSVIVNDMKVHVLGTHFNVNAYPDEKFRKTTLLEGSVKITSGPATATLQKGEQVQLTMNGQMHMIDDPDLDEAIAWKNGLFSFKDADLATIMRQFARWYDLTVRYEGETSKRRFTGEVFRNLKLSEALKVLELNDVRFTIEGKRLTVFQ